MATTEGQLPPGEDLEQQEEVVEDPRDAWLTLALADMDGGAAALATAARGGRPLPPRTPKR